MEPIEARRPAKAIVTHHHGSIEGPLGVTLGGIMDQQPHARVEIARPAAEVFAYVSDATNDPTWVRVCQEIRPLTPPPVGPGARLGERVRIFGLPYRYEWEVTRFEPGRLIEYTSRRGFAPMVILIEVAASARGAEVRQTLALRMPWYVPFGKALAQWIAHTEATKNLQALRARLEGSTSP